MTSGPIISWQIDRETMETMSNFIFLGSKITAGGDCSHEIKRFLLLGRKDMTNLDSIFKSRDITLPTKVRLVKAMVYPVVMYGCEIWTVQKAEYRRIDAFEVWCWRRLLRVPWTARRSSQSILKEITPGCSLEGMMLKLKLQYVGYLIRRVDSLEKALMLGGIWGSRKRGQQEAEMAGWHHRLNGRGFEWTPGDGDRQGGLACCDSWGRKELDTTEQLNWTDTWIAQRWVPEFINNFMRLLFWVLFPLWSFWYFLSSWGPHFPAHLPENWASSFPAAVYFLQMHLDRGPKEKKCKPDIWPMILGPSLFWWKRRISIPQKFSYLQWSSF